MWVLGLVFILLLAVNAAEPSVGLDAESAVEPSGKRVGLDAESRTSGKRLLSTLISTADYNATFFSFANVMQSWTVPGGVAEILVDACGAQGGGYSLTYGSSGYGGNGGYIQTTVPVTSLTSLFIFVGGQSGFNGGGASSQSCTGSDCYAGPGGGATDIRTGAPMSTRIVVAGGGGGVGYSCRGSGAGGGLIGGGSWQSTGGSQTAGGTSSITGGDGSLGLGGSATQASYNSYTPGGGAGYYGGGAGCPATGGSSYSSGQILVNNQGDSRCTSDGALSIRISKCVSATTGCCNAGFFTGPSNACTACPAGSYSSYRSQSCTACPAGTYTGTSGSPTCMPCSPGYYSPVGATSCLPCSAGTTSAQRSSSCTPCAPGTFSGPGFASCTSCNPGMYTAVVGASICSNCPAGKVSSTTGSTSCTPCSISTFAPTIGQPSCSVCPLSKISNVGASSCFNVSLTFFYTNGPQLFQVPTGVASIRVDAYGAAGAPGSFQQTNYYNQGGFTAQVSGGLGGFIASLIDVEQGKSLFVDVGSWGALASYYTTSCLNVDNVPSQSNGYGGGGFGLGNNYYGTGTGGGASSIMTIPFNLSSRIIVAGGGGSAYIYGGFPGGGLVGGGGSRGGTQTSGGVGCPGAVPAGFGIGGSPNPLSPSGGSGGGGWYGGGAGCSNNTAFVTGGGGGSSHSIGKILANVQGAESPLSQWQCSQSGYVSVNFNGVANGNGVVYITVVACTGGYYLSNADPQAAPSCQPCPAGTFSTYKSNVCVLCPAGTFSNVIGATGATSCSPNPAGTFSTAVGAVIATSQACPAGTFSSAGASTCTPCAAGSFSTAFASSCTPCAAGSYASTGQPCQMCPSGSFALEGASTCASCPVGYFSGPGSSACGTCAS